MKLFGKPIHYDDGSTTLTTSNRNESPSGRTLLGEPLSLLSTVSLRAVGEAIQSFSLLRRGVYTERSERALHKDIKIKGERDSEGEVTAI